MLNINKKQLNDMMLYKQSCEIMKNMQLTFFKNRKLSYI